VKDATATAVEDYKIRAAYAK